MLCRITNAVAHPDHTVTVAWSDGIEAVVDEAAYFCDRMRIADDLLGLQCPNRVDFSADGLRFRAFPNEAEAEFGPSGNRPCPAPAVHHAPRSMIDLSQETEIRPPAVTASDSHAVAVFINKLRITYDVSQVIMFGSRARGDGRPDSDLDLAVVLNGQRGDFIDTKLDMAGLAFDALMETGILVQAFPIWDGDLAHPERFPNPVLIRTIAREGIRLG